MVDISIITACRDSADTLESCIDSVRQQELVAEHIIIDCVSKDGTEEILKKRNTQVSRIIIEPDKGIYDAINKGIRLSTGNIIGILHADDYYPSTQVLSRVQEVFRDPDIGACYGDLVYVSRADNRKVIRHWRAGEFNKSRFYHGWMPPHPTFFTRRELYEKFGLYNMDMGTAADYELMLRFLLKHDVNAAYIPEILVHMRTGGISNRSIVNRLIANRMDRKAWEVNQLTPYPWTIIAKPIRKLGQWL